MQAPSFEPETVFLTVGTSLDPFDRLLRMVDDLCQEGQVLYGLSVLGQRGACRYVPERFPVIPFLPAPELEDRIRAARVVICHGGAGTIGTCLQLGKRPVVVPRRAVQREIVNDHQLELCRKLAEEGRIYLAEDSPALSTALTAALLSGEAPPHRGGDRLRLQIGRLLSEIAARRRR